MKAHNPTSNVYLGLDDYELIVTRVQELLEPPMMVIVTAQSSVPVIVVTGCVLLLRRRRDHAWLERVFRVHRHRRVQRRRR